MSLGSTCPAGTGVTWECSHSITPLTAPEGLAWESSTAKGVRRDNCGRLSAQQVWGRGRHSCAQPGAQQGPHLPSLLSRGSQCSRSSLLAPPAANPPGSQAPSHTAHDPAWRPTWNAMWSRVFAQPLLVLPLTVQTSALASQANRFMDNINYHVAH